eukprot:6217524-Amphidinium_carterae.1
MQEKTLLNISSRLSTIQRLDRGEATGCSVHPFMPWRYFYLRHNKPCYKRCRPQCTQKLMSATTAVMTTAAM